MLNIVVIASTNGSVLSKVLSLKEVRDSISMIVSDRPCGAIDVAKKYGINTKVYKVKTGEELSRSIVNDFENGDVDYFLLFYTKLIAKDFILTFPNKILNFHTSLLPSFPGLDGFGDSVKYKSKFIGSTLHYVDEGMDSGIPLIQSIYPYQVDKSLSENRHKVFIQQCKIFIQFVYWAKQERICKCSISKAKSEFSEFVPNLDCSEAINFKV